MTLAKSTERSSPTECFFFVILDIYPDKIWSHVLLHCTARCELLGDSDPNQAQMCYLCSISTSFVSSSLYTWYCCCCFCCYDYNLLSWQQCSHCIIKINWLWSEILTNELALFFLLAHYCCCCCYYSSNDAQHVAKQATSGMRQQTLLIICSISAPTTTPLHHGSLSLRSPATQTHFEDGKDGGAFIKLVHQLAIKYPYFYVLMLHTYIYKYVYLIFDLQTLCLCITLPPHSPPLPVEEVK